MAPRLAVLILVWSSAVGVSALPVRVKDLVRVEGMEDVPVVGYGLVVGLDGTGDREGANFTTQSVVNMLQRFGIAVPRGRLRLRNTAAVMVTASVPPSAGRGTKVDVVVSSIGNARSLEGGTLLPTPLLGEDGEVYVYAQGPVSIGGFNIEAGMGESVEFRGGDYADPAMYEGGFDLVLIANVLHQERADRAAKLVSLGSGSLNPGGRLAVIDFAIDDERRESLVGALFAINMRSFGDTHTAPAIQGWMEAAGLSGFDREDFAGSRWLLTATKPA